MRWWEGGWKAYGEDDDVCAEAGCVGYFVGGVFEICGFVIACLAWVLAAVYGGGVGR